MIRKPITFTNFDGETVTEVHHFNLNKVEVAKMEAGSVGGYSGFLKRIVEAKDSLAMLNVITDLVEKSYGIKEPDGKTFTKSKELTDKFVNSLAFEALFMELVSTKDSTKKMIEFVKGILPKDMVSDEKVAEIVAANT